MRETDDPTVGSSRTINIGQDAQKNVCTLQDAVSSMTSLRDDWTVEFSYTMRALEYLVRLFEIIFRNCQSGSARLSTAFVYHFRA